MKTGEDPNGEQVPNKKFGHERNGNLPHRFRGVGGSPNPAKGMATHHQKVHDMDDLNQETLEPTSHPGLRLLPWTSPDGKPCFLSGDGTGYVARLADDLEVEQLDTAADLLTEARELLGVPKRERSPA